MHEIDVDGSGTVNYTELQSQLQRVQRCKDRAKRIMSSVLLIVDLRKVRAADYT